MAPVASWGGKKNLALHYASSQTLVQAHFPRGARTFLDKLRFCCSPIVHMAKLLKSGETAISKSWQFLGRKWRRKKNQTQTKPNKHTQKIGGSGRKGFLWPWVNTSWSPFPSLIQPFYTLYLFQRKKKSTLILAPLMKPKHPFPLTPQIQMIIPSSATSYINHCSRQFRLSLQTKPILPEIACSSINFSCVVYNMLTPPRIASTSHLPRDKALQPLLALNTRALRIY